MLYKLGDNTAPYCTPLKVRVPSPMSKEVVLSILATTVITSMGSSIFSISISRRSLFTRSNAFLASRKQINVLSLSLGLVPIRLLILSESFAFSDIANTYAIWSSVLALGLKPY